MKNDILPRIKVGSGGTAKRYWPFSDALAIKTKKALFVGTALAVAILRTHGVSAQAPWTTVDDFEFGFGGSSGDIGADPLGSILYSVGSAGIDPEGNGRAAAVVRTSADKRATWTVLDTYAPEGWSDPHLRGVATLKNPDATTRVLAAGHLYNQSTGDQTWIIRESAQGDQNWALTDVVDVPNGWSSCGDIKVNSGADVYAAGLIRDTVQNTGYWLVRKRVAGAASFQTVDSVYSTVAEARGIPFHPTAGVLVAGSVGNVWTVRRSTNGLAWSTVDSFPRCRRIHVIRRIHFCGPDVRSHLRCWPRSTNHTGHKG